MILYQVQCTRCGDLKWSDGSTWAPYGDPFTSRETAQDFIRARRAHDAELDWLHRHNLPPDHLARLWCIVEVEPCAQEPTP